MHIAVTSCLLDVSEYRRLTSRPINNKNGAKKVYVLQRLPEM